MTRGPSRRGAVYLAVLATTAVLAVMAVGAVQVAGGGLRSAITTAESKQAAAAALSAVELGLAQTRGARRALGANTWYAGYDGPAGSEPGPEYPGTPLLPFQSELTGDYGTYGFTATDPADGDLSDDPSDPVDIVGVALVGGAAWAEAAVLVDNQGRPLAPLGAALHARDGLRIEAGAVLDAAGAPASTDGELDLNGDIVGDAHAASVIGSGDISGLLQTGLPPKGVAPRDIFQRYAAIATALPFAGDMVDAVLAPGANTYAPSAGANDHGIYAVNIGSGSLEITGSRLHGTLVVLGNEGATVTVSGLCFMEPARPDAPVLLVRGDLRLELLDGALDEGSESLNPAGAPFLGIEDDDLDDLYPSGIRGLVHVLGGVVMREDGRYTGSILVDGAALIDGFPRIRHDDMLLLAPPMGYGDNAVPGDLRILPRSVHRIEPP